VGLDDGWLFTGLAVLLGFFALVIESVVSVLDFACESSALSGSEEFNDLFGGEGVDLFGSVSSEGVLLEAFLFFLHGGHLLWIIKSILFIWINCFIIFCLW
jgi:hypothetical protein